MNTLELKNEAKVKIEEISHQVEALKTKADQLDYRMKEEWNEEIHRIEKQEDSLRNIYTRISQEHTESVNELAQAFNREYQSAESRIEHLRESQSKTLN